MKSKNFAHKSIVAAFSVAAVMGFTACSDSESSDAADTLAGEPISGDSHCEALVPECGYTAEQLCAMGMANYCIAAPTEEECVAPIPAVFTQSDFNDIGDVYKNIQCNEKAVFIVRHAEREGFTGSVSALTESGFEAALHAGTKLAGPGEFKYIFSGMTRTMQTALGIAAGRGDVTYTTTYAEGEDGNEHFTVVSPEFSADTITQLKDGWFLKDKDLRDQYQKADSIKNSNVLYAAWAYDGKYADAFYDLNDRSQELVNLIVKDYAEMPKYTVVASHDQVLMPLTVWATEKQIDLKLHNVEAPRNWLNFLAGVAIIINDKNEVRYAPIKGMDDSVMPDGTIISGGVQ